MSEEVRDEFDRLRRKGAGILKGGDNAYRPLLYKEVMMDMARGREIS